MKVVIVVQARISSTRLPGKIMLDILGRSVLFRQLERMRAAQLADETVIAATTDEADDPIVKLCEREGMNLFRGHPDDLLDRHYKAGLEYRADVVVKIPSDCPLIDPKAIDRVLKFYRDNSDKYDFVSNLHPQTYPDGNDVEVMPMPLLKEAWEKAEKKFEREHTTPYFWDNPERFRIGNVEWESGKNYSMTHRFTIDYIEDYHFIKRVYEELYPKNPLFSLEEILNLLDEKPEIMEINSKYAGVNWYRNHIGELKTIDKSETKII